MYHNNKISLFLLLGMLLVLFACEDEDKIRFPEFEDGVNMRVVIDPNKSFLDFADLTNARFAYEVFSENQNLDAVNFFLTYVAPDTTYPEVLVESFGQADFTNGKLAREYTSEQMANWLGLTSAELNPGDQFNFRTVVELTNGMVFPDTILRNVEIGGAKQNFLNVTPNILNNAATTSFTSTFSTFVLCEFIRDEALGKYQIVRDDFVTTLDPTRLVEAVAGPGPNDVTFVNLFSHPEMYDVVVSVPNPSNAVAQVSKQPAWHCDNFGCGFGEGRVEGTGLFFSCAGNLALNLKHTVDAGSFGTFALTLQKVE